MSKKLKEEPDLVYQYWCENCYYVYKPNGTYKKKCPKCGSKEYWGTPVGIKEVIQMEEKEKCSYDGGEHLWIEKDGKTICELCYKEQSA